MEIGDRTTYKVRMRYEMIRQFMSVGMMAEKGEADIVLRG